MANRRRFTTLELELLGENVEHEAKRNDRLSWSSEGYEYDADIDDYKRKKRARCRTEQKRRDEFGAELEDDIEMVGYSVYVSDTTDMFGDEVEFRNAVATDDDGSETAKEEEGGNENDAKRRGEEDDLQQEEDDGESTETPGKNGAETSDGDFPDPAMPSVSGASGISIWAEVQNQIQGFL
ncbi:MAG: hypothetical protein Q9225_003248 [Loekoesia sp. 1 TL-2023]